jgi:pimeloyl-ACP methyl ester carboxylesterase
MPAPHLVTTNGIRMAVYERGEGLPVVFVHGFPELAYSWRNQLRSYPAAGLRAIAPDMRGYGLTDRPAEVDGYAIPSLCADLVGLLDALDIERALFCGHDWGGAAVWTLPRLYPDRVLGIIGVNTPAFGGQPPSGPAEEPLIVRTENYYSTTFLEPGRAEAVFSRDVRRALQMIFRRGWYWDVENMRRYPPDSAEKQMDMLRMIEEGDYEGELVLPEDVLGYWTETFEVTGFTGGFNYYRANFGGGGGGGGTPPPPPPDIEVPCLYVGAENDTILRPSSSDGMPSFIPDLERHVIADCGHWTQQEKPEEFDRVTLDWIRRKFQNA